MKKLVYGAYLNMGKEYEYAVYKLRKEGIYVHYTNNPPQEGFVFHREPSSGRIIIPARIRKAYQIDEYIDIKRLDETLYFIKAELKEKKPVPYVGTGFRAVPEKHITTHPIDEAYFNQIGRLYVKNLIPTDWEYRKITVYAGDYLRIEVEDVTNNHEKYPSLDALQIDYGARLQHYQGTYMTYVQKITASTYRVIPIPKFFRLNANIFKGSMFDCYQENHNGKTIYVFCQKKQECELTKREIIPANEKPEHITLCETCNEEKDELGQVMQEIMELKEMVKNLKEIYLKTKNENMELQNKINQVKGVLDV